MICEEAVHAKHVPPQMRPGQQLAAQGRDIVLKADVVAAQPVLDDALDRPEKLRDEDVRQGHAGSQQPGPVRQDMAKARQAPEHVDQQLPCFCMTSRDGFADLGQHLDLETVRRPYHASETRDPHGRTALMASQPEPGGFFPVREIRALSFEPPVHAGRDAAKGPGLLKIGRPGAQRIELMDRYAFHAGAAGHGAL